jgi:carbonic anhydrase
MLFKINSPSALIAILASLLLSACAATAPIATDSKQAKGSAICETQNSKSCQTKVSAEMVIEHLQEGNTRFVAGKPLQRNVMAQVKATSAGQYPLASIVSCIDSRAPAEMVFDQGIGDIFNARIAGNIVNDDILGSLEFASKLAGAKLVVVLGHTSCGAIKGACDDAKLGNLTGLLDKIKPVVGQTALDITGDRSSKNYKFVELVAEANVKATVNNIRQKSPVLREMEQKGDIKIVGAMYDVKTGAVTWYDTPAQSVALK